MTKEIIDVDMMLIKEIPFSFAKGNLVMPIKREAGELLAAVADEQGMLALIDLAKHYGLRPKPMTMASGAIIDAINRAYGQLSTAEEVMSDITGEDLSSVASEFEKPKDLLELTEEAPIIRLLNSLLQQAVKEKASDIHIEPYEKEIEVRFRVDGILHRVLSPPKIIQDALLSRIKIVANLDIAEKRLPQDGRIRLLIGGSDVDIRVSIIPTTYGERAVLRLLDRKKGLLGLNSLGLDSYNEKLFSDFLCRTNGIILVTGPTGSGKSTTLYAALNSIHSEDKNIITVEDPVEYQLKGIGQIQVNPKIGLSFASGLRSILRQDPDVIMVGEIRDVETAAITIQASLTGHLVLSTLHTNDAASAITRILDMEIEPFLVASSLVAVLAQRLVRNICPYCKEELDFTELDTLYFSAEQSKSLPSKLTRGKGCIKCKQTGYFGRTALFELLSVDSEVRKMIVTRTDSQAIRNYAVSRGMKTLYRDGLMKVREGQTTLQEVLRVIHKDHADI